MSSETGLVRSKLWHSSLQTLQVAQNLFGCKPLGRFFRGAQIFLSWLRSDNLVLGKIDRRHEGPYLFARAIDEVDRMPKPLQLKRKRIWQYKIAHGNRRL
jgi:hypothetical protein